MVRGDHVAQDRQHLGAFDVGDHARLRRHALEVGRVLHVGRGGGQS